MDTVLWFSSVTQSCPTLCNPMDCSTPGLLSFTVSWSLLKLMSIESMMASNHLIICHPLEAVLVVPRPVPRHCINVKSGFSRRSDLLKDTQVAVDRTVAETPFQPLLLSRCNGGGFFLSVFLCR